MPTRKKKEEYISHAIPKKITATSRCAIKIRDNYYTIETSEEREISNLDGINMDKEWELLFNEINTITDSQIQEIFNEFKKKA